MSTIARKRSYELVAEALGSPAGAHGGSHRLLFTTFDPEVAEVSGVNVRWINALLLLLPSFAPSPP